MENKYYELFETKDQIQATLLYSLSFKLDSRFQDGKSIFFVFEDRERCEKVIKEYYNNELTMNPRVFVDALQTIKHMIHNN